MSTDKLGICSRCGQEKPIPSWSSNHACDGCQKAAEAKVVKACYDIPDELWDAFYTKISCSELTSDHARGTVVYGSGVYVIDGCCGDRLTARQVKPLVTWAGPAYTYVECIKVNGSGNCFRNNEKFKADGAWWVMVPDLDIEFQKVIVPKMEQGRLF